MYVFGQVDVGAFDTSKLVLLSIAAVFVFLFWPRITEFFGQMRATKDETAVDDVAEFRTQVKNLLARKKAVEQELQEVLRLLAEIQGELK
jgi:hypothetical protein